MVVNLVISALLQPGLGYFTDLLCCIDPIIVIILPRTLDWVLLGSLLCLGMKEWCFSGGHGLLFYGSALVIRSAI